MYSAYKEFSNVVEAERAARALRSAGFEHVETEDLSHSLQSISDVDLPAPNVEQSYELSGIMTGLLAGAEIGLLLFGLPPLVLAMHHAVYIVVLGTLICMIVGAVVGLLEGVIVAKRWAAETSGRIGLHAVGVRVKAESTRRILHAKALMSQYGERPAAVFRRRLVPHF